MGGWTSQVVLLRLWQSSASRVLPHSSGAVGVSWYFDNFQGLGFRV